MDKGRIIRDHNSIYSNRTGENRDWRKNDFSYNPRRMIVYRMQRKEAEKRILCGVLSMVSIMLILVLFLTYLLYDPVNTTRICVPGFTGVNCDKSNFLGSFVWSVDNYYILDDGLQHRSGIAFRVYAPNANGVSVIVKPELGIEMTYSMIKQTEGYWFYNVGSVGVHAEYMYIVETMAGIQEERLIQGGKEAVITSRGWRNREPDDSLLIQDSSIRQFKEKRRDNEIMYTLHIPSFSMDEDVGHGTFLSTISLLPYLKDLGVTVIRLMDLTPQRCVNDTIHVKCWYHSHVVYPDVLHPELGSQQELKLLIDTIHSLGMLVLVDLDWSGFDEYSNYYNYDGSSLPTSFGPLFQNSSLYEYHERTSRSINLDEEHTSSLLLTDVLYRFAYVYQFDGFYWKGLLCLRLDGHSCQVGEGADNTHSIQFLKNSVNSFNDVTLWYGEDDDNIYSVISEASSIRDILNTQRNQGLAFDGKRDLTVLHQLELAYLSNSTIHLDEIVKLVLNWSSFSTKAILSLETLETLHHQRFIQRVAAVIPEEFIMQAVMQMTFLLYATPGILNFYQGSEYLEQERMEDLPSVLRIQDKVGQLEGNSWIRKQSRYWLYQYTKRCLNERALLGLYWNTEIALYYRDDRTGLLVFTMETQAGSRLLILHANKEPLTKSVNIVVPAPYGNHTIWENEFNTDDPSYPHGNEMYIEPISVKDCSDHEIEKWCGVLRLGSFAVRILYPEYVAFY